MRTMITDDRMWSADHPHTATRVGAGEWKVSWIPDTKFTRDQATTASVIADFLIAKGTTDPKRLGRTDLAFLAQWAEELGLLTSEVLMLFELANSK